MPIDNFIAASVLILAVIVENALAALAPGASQNVDVRELEVAVPISRSVLVCCKSPLKLRLKAVASAVVPVIPR
jgi:hypothetical protein